MPLCYLMSGVAIKKNFLYLFIFMEIINNQVELGTSCTYISCSCSEAFKG